MCPVQTVTYLSGRSENHPEVHCREQEVHSLPGAISILRTYATQLPAKGSQTFSCSQEPRGTLCYADNGAGMLLAEHRKHAKSDRWVFTNGDGKPESHFCRF